MTKAKKEPYEVGQLTQEGIFIARLKDKDGVEKNWFADVTDAQDSKGKRLGLTFNEAAKFATNSNSLGHHDWIVPPGLRDPHGRPDVLNALFNSKSKGAFKGTFDETGSWQTGSLFSGWYRSSSLYWNQDSYAQVQRFIDGNQDDDYKRLPLAVRAVRSVAV